jgi:hypothetical protein
VLLLVVVVGVLVEQPASPASCHLPFPRSGTLPPVGDVGPHRSAAPLLSGIRDLGDIGSHGGGLVVEAHGMWVGFHTR